MNPRILSRLIALAGLGVAAATFAWPPGGAAMVLALPPLVLLATGLRPAPRWGGWAAVLMIPYFCYGVMELLVPTAPRWSAMLLVAGSLAVFFAGLDSVRRAGVSLRR